MGTFEWWEPLVWLWFAVAISLLVRGKRKREREKESRLSFGEILRRAGWLRNDVEVLRSVARRRRH